MAARCAFEGAEAEGGMTAPHCPPGSKLCGDCMQAWLDRKPTPHLGPTVRFEFGRACFAARCWCAETHFGRLLIQGADGKLVPQELPEGFWGDVDPEAESKPATIAPFDAYVGLEPGEEA
jgi:hypothetical protein